MMRSFVYGRQENAIEVAVGSGGGGGGEAKGRTLVEKSHECFSLGELCYTVRIMHDVDHTIAVNQSNCTASMAH
jgi:hypothetical protein